MSNAEESSLPNGSALRKALHGLVETLETRSIAYAIIGGIATIQHARVRTTNDVDAIVDVPKIRMPSLFEALRSVGFVTDSRLNTVELKDSGFTTIQFDEVLVDLMRPVLPVFAHVIERAIPQTIGGQLVRVSSPECLLVTKLLAFRPQDQADIIDLIAARGDQLDLNFIRSEFASVAAEDDPRWLKLIEWLEQKRSDSSSHE